MSSSPVPEPSISPETSDWFMQQRPALFRYCTRMTGSVFDGEDAVQDTLLKAMRAFPGFAALQDPKAWLFRVAYNASMDVLRARARLPEAAGDDMAEAVADPGAFADALWITRAALRHFMWLTPVERSCVILMDVLGYTLQEIAEITGRTVLSVKASLHRGRTRLKEVADCADTREAAALAPEEQALLERYIRHFNARDFDAVRAMLGEEVRLDLVGRIKLQGKAQVGTYVHRYADKDDWVFVPGIIQGQPAALAYDPAAPGQPPSYFVLLRFANGRVQHIRDFRYARYASEALPLTAADALPDWGTGPAPARH